MDWNKIVELFIATLPATLMALAAVITSISNHWKMKEVIKATDGMADKLVLNAEQKGLAQGGMAERARADDREAKK